MTKYKKSRANYPDGVLGIYDNGGRSADRYTVVYAPYDLDGTLWYTYTAMSAAPYHPQGVGMYGETTHRITRDTAGKTINLEDLPEACQRVVAEDLASCRYCGRDHLARLGIRCPAEPADAEHEADVECIYCYSLTTPVDVPTVGDDAMWDAIAGEHDPECEWVQTRAHRLEEGA